MARYKPVDPHLSKMLPVRFADQRAGRIKTRRYAASATTGFAAPSCRNRRMAARAA